MTTVGRITQLTQIGRETAQDLARRFLEQIQAHEGDPELEQTPGIHKGIGTQKAGYAGPEFGPFRCDHCQHYSYEGQTCDNPTVIEDMEEQGLVLDGKAQVSPGGCCNLFRTRKAE